MLRAKKEQPKFTKKGKNMLIHFELPTESETTGRHRMRRGVSNRFPVDIIETEHGTTVYAELPGVKKADVQITFEDEILTITGKRPEKEIPDEARILLHEQRIREFNRSIRIGHPVEQESLTATLENGLLSVDVPKAAIARPRTIEIS